MIPFECIGLSAFVFDTDKPVFAIIGIDDLSFIRIDLFGYFICKRVFKPGDGPVFILITYPYFIVILLREFRVKREKSVIGPWRSQETAVRNLGQKA